MLRLLNRWAKRRGVKVDLTGVDRNPRSPGTATEVIDHGSAIRFVAADVFDFCLLRGVDIVISSLRTIWIRARPAFSPRRIGAAFSPPPASPPPR